MRAFAACLFLFAAGVAAAQDKKDDKKPEPKGEEVAGTVTYKGKPVAGVKVTFTSKDGKTTVAATADDDGKYKATMPAGEHALSLTPPEKGLKIPAEYGDPKTSGLTIAVKAGKNSFDINIDP